MFRVDVIQNTWVLLAIVGGIGAMLFFVQAYLGMWRPREDSTKEPETQRWRDIWRYIPWFLIFSYIATILFMLTYSFYYVKHPPNW